MLYEIRRRAAVAVAGALLAMSANAQSVTGELMDAAVKAELAELPAGATYSAFVHFDQGSKAEQDAILEQHNMVLVKDFREYATSVFVEAPVSAFHAIAGHDWVSYIEHNTELRYLGETQSWATRVRVAQEPVSGGPYYADAAETQILDGTGVTLGVIDSGVFGAHPDFADNLLYNFKLVNPTSITGNGPGYVEIGMADSESQVGGHGTHVTGTVGGSGAASNGTYTGAAPGADLVHWGNGAGLLVLDTTAAYADMLDRIDAGEPGFENLVAVNNSYGADPGPYNPNATSSQLINEIIARDVVMAFAASNDGGDGTTAMTSPACRNPTPGVICVASHDDRGTGDRDSNLSSFSSRGRKDDASTKSFPDIAAPGDLITSTCVQGLPSQAICSTGAETDWQPYYGTISGTSMATPHIVGIIGVIQQAYKGKHGEFMTPAQVEDIIQDTALKVDTNGAYVPDPQNPDGTTNFGFGAGLVDVPAILDALEIAKAGHPEPGADHKIFENDHDSGTGSDVVSLVMRDAVVDGVNGIEHVLILGSDSLVEGTRYTIERNVAGKAHTTSVIANASGGVDAATDGEGSSAPATRITLDGSMLSVFVPNLSVGAPAIGEPVHNIRVVVRNASGDPLDFAPSPEGAVDPAIDEFQSMFGNAFTVGLEAGGSAEVDPLVACEAPGRRILTDETNDMLVEGNPATAPYIDLEWLNITQPQSDGGDYRLLLQVKVASLEVPGPAEYPLQFKVAGDDGDWEAYLDLTVPQLPLFGLRYTPKGGTAQTIDIHPDSNFTADGLITFVLTPNEVPSLQGPGQDVLSDFLIRNTAVLITPDNMPSSLAPSGRYESLAEGACRGDSTGGGNTAPVAEDGSETVAYETATDITLSATDADGDALSYSIVDGPTNGTLSSDDGDATVTYTPDAGYSGADSFTFKASDGQADSNVATVSITVEESGGGAEANSGTLDAELSVSTTSGSLTASFDASDSHYEENADPIHEPEYKFVFGDGQETPFQGSAVMDHTYDAAGQYTAYVIVRDGNGESAVSEGVPFELTYTISVGPDGGENQSRFTIDNASGEAPLEVTFDASPTVTADGWEITSYAWDFDFDESEGFTADASGQVVTHVYTEAGDYTPKLQVTYTQTETGETQTKSASAVVKATAPGTNPPPKVESSSGGSLGWLLLGPLALVGIRRRCTKG